MPVNFPINTVTLQVGSRTFGPASVPDGDSFITLTIDRTVAGGLNALTLSSVLTMEAQVSTDGGNTWHAVDTDQVGTVTMWQTVGSPITFTDKQGVQHVYTASSATWPLFPGTGRRIQAIATVAGPSSIVISGSIVTN